MFSRDAEVQIVYMNQTFQPLITTNLPCWVIGHRGAAAVRPENTLLSFQTARDAGACMIEFDVQPSADGELIVFHDANLTRLCGESTLVTSLSYAALSSRVVGRYQGASLHMPRLLDVFATFQQSLLYNIELKTEEMLSFDIVKRLVNLIREYRVAERVVISSFHHENLRLVREYAPDLALGLLLSLEQGCHLNTPAKMVALAHEFASYAIHPDFRLLRLYPALVEQSHDAGLRVFPWTVDHPHVWQVLIGELGVDGVITNDPGKLYEWLLAR